MLAKKSTLPRLRYYKSQQRNPLVELPSAFQQLENKIAYALLTHCQKGHFDHLDKAAERWLQNNEITTFCTKHDSRYLTKKGINTEVLKEQCS